MMRHLKTEFARFFALGFAGGALLVFCAMGIDRSGTLGENVMPAAEAAANG